MLKRFKPYKLGKKCGAFIYDEHQNRYIFRFGTIIARNWNVRHAPDKQWQYAFRFEKNKVALVEHDNIMPECIDLKEVKNV